MSHLTVATPIATVNLLSPVLKDATSRLLHVHSQYPPSIAVRRASVALETSIYVTGPLQLTEAQGSGDDNEEIIVFNEPLEPVQRQTWYR